MSNHILIQHPTEPKFLDISNVNPSPKTTDIPVFDYGVKKYITDKVLLQDWEDYQQWINKNPKILIPRSWTKKISDAEKFTVDKIEKIKDNYQHIQKYQKLFLAIKKEISKTVSVEHCKYLQNQSCVSMEDKLNHFIINTGFSFSSSMQVWEDIVQQRVKLYSNQAQNVTSCYVIYLKYNNNFGFLGEGRKLVYFNNALTFPSEELALSHMQRSNSFSQDYYIIKTSLAFDQIVFKKQSSDLLPEELAVLVSSAEKKLLTQQTVKEQPEDIQPLLQRVELLEAILRANNLNIPPAKNLELEPAKKIKCL